MQRGQYNPVTNIPILIPCREREKDGVANFLQAKIEGIQNGEIVSRQTPVRTLRDTDMDRHSGAGEKIWRTLALADQKRLLGLIGLRQALEADDPVAIEKLESDYLNLMPDLVSLLPDTPEPKKEIIHKAVARWYAQKGVGPVTLAKILTHALRSARLVLWWHDKQRRFLPAIFCPDIGIAMYVRALLGIVQGNAFLVCPHCGTPFVQQRSDQDYCSIRCREAHRVARWRAAQNAKGARGKKKIQRSKSAKR